MGHLLLTRGRTIRKGFRRKTLSSEIRIGMISLILTIIFLITGMSLLSLTQLNETATKGYQINRLEKEYQELVTDGELTDRLLLQARSLEAIKNNEVVRRMIKPAKDQITYLEGGTELAKN